MCHNSIRLSQQSSLGFSRSFPIIVLFDLKSDYLLKQVCNVNTFNTKWISIISFCNVELQISVQWCCSDFQRIFFDYNFFLLQLICWVQLVSWRQSAPYIVRWMQDKGKVWIHRIASHDSRVADFEAVQCVAVSPQSQVLVDTQNTRMFMLFGKKCQHLRGYARMTKPGNWGPGGQAKSD